MLAASFQAEAQYSVTFGNKSHCDMDVEIILCNTSATNATVAINTPQTFNFSDEINYAKVYYGGLLAYFIVFVSSCSSITSHYVGAPSNSCDVGYSASGTQANGLDFSVW